MKFVKILALFLILITLCSCVNKTNTDTEFKWVEYYQDENGCEYLIFKYQGVDAEPRLDKEGKQICN